MSRRSLSDEERALWEGIAKTAKPLRKLRRKTVVIAAAEADKDKPVRTAKPMPAAPAPKQSQKISAPPLTQMTRRERARVAKGRSEIDARLDLHGKTLAQAHGVLLRFLHRARAEGFTLVLVITGKGRMAGVEREAGALRREVPHWLATPEFRVLVSGFETAHVGHGGDGALYVRVRRGR